MTLQLVSLSVKFGFQLVTGFISEHRLEGDLQFCVVGRTPPSVFEIVDPIHETQNSVQTLLQKLSSNFFQTVIFLWACLHTDISPETLCQCETCLLSHSKVAILLKRKCFFFFCFSVSSAQFVHHCIQYALSPRQPFCRHRPALGIDPLGFPLSLPPCSAACRAAELSLGT